MIDIWEVFWDLYYTQADWKVFSKVLRNVWNYMPFLYMECQIIAAYYT